jgi:hypothetical protein
MPIFFSTLFLWSGIFGIAQSQLLPLPQSATIGATTLSLKNSFHFSISVTQAESSILQAASLRYQKLISAQSGSADGEISSCSLSSSDPNEGDVLGSDESYQVSISEAGDCKITGETVWGYSLSFWSFFSCFS